MMPTNPEENHCEERADPKNHKPVIVLGMHKSGTTFLAKTLHESGINMVDQTLDAEYDEGNKWERQSLLQLNKEALQCGNRWSILVRTPIAANDPAWKNTEPGVMQEIERLNTEYPRWGFKDPRTCMTYDGWKAILPEHELICVIRHPHAIWPRYKRQGDAGKGFFKKLAACRAFHRCYASYMQAIEKAVGQHPRPLLFTYDELIESDGWMDRLKQHLGLQEIADARTRKSTVTPPPDLYTRLCERQEKRTNGITCSEIYEKLKARCSN